MKNKMLSITIATAMIASLLVGCGNTTTTSSETFNAVPSVSAEETVVEEVVEEVVTTDDIEEVIPKAKANMHYKAYRDSQKKEDESNDILIVDKEVKGKDETTDLQKKSTDNTIKNDAKTEVVTSNNVTPTNNTVDTNATVATTDTNVTNQTPEPTPAPQPSTQTTTTEKPKETTPVEPAKTPEKTYANTTQEVKDMTGLTDQQLDDMFSGPREVEITFIGKSDDCTW